MSAFEFCLGIWILNHCSSSLLKFPEPELCSSNMCTHMLVLHTWFPSPLRNTAKLRVLWPMMVPYHQPVQSVEPWACKFKHSVHSECGQVSHWCTCILQCLHINEWIGHSAMEVDRYTLDARNAWKIEMFSDMLFENDKFCSLAWILNYWHFPLLALCMDVPVCANGTNKRFVIRILFIWRWSIIWLVSIFQPPIIFTVHFTPCMEESLRNFRSLSMFFLSGTKCSNMIHCIQGALHSMSQCTKFSLCRAQNMIRVHVLERLVITNVSATIPSYLFLSFNGILFIRIGSQKIMLHPSCLLIHFWWWS